MTRRIVQIVVEHWHVAVMWSDGTVDRRPLHDLERLLDTPDPDPIAELEAMGGYLASYRTAADEEIRIEWRLPQSRAHEDAGLHATVADLRAAAARLLARVRGGAK